MPLITWDEFSGTEVKGGTIAEIVLSEVTNLTARDRPLMSSIGQRDVNSLYVELLTDTLASRGANSVLEGVAATDPTLTQASRHAVPVQSFAKWGQVSDEQRMVRHYNEEPFTYQVKKAVNELMNDIEHALHQGSEVSGNASTARQFDGLLNMFSTTTLTATSGVTLDEQVFIDLIQVFQDNNYDVRPTQCYVNSWLKRTISEFSTRITRNVDAVQRMQTLIIERHSSDFGDLDIMYTRDQLKGTTSTGVGNSLIFLDPQHFKVGWLKKPTVERLPRDGFRTRFQINAQCTLLYMNQLAGGGATNLVPYLNQA